MKQIKNHKSKRNGLLVEVLDSKFKGNDGTCQLPKHYLKVRYGDGLVVWTMSEHVVEPKY